MRGGRAPSPAAACLDHLVVLASNLASGVDWCERKFGLTPTVGGEHPLMGTHNRIFNVSSAAHPRAYLEILAINPGATPAILAGAKRWFDLDKPELQHCTGHNGPQLIHWVASVADVQARCDALSTLGVQRGNIINVSRPTPQGLLQWLLTVRDDGDRLMDGCLPSLIQWGDVHPCDSLPPSGVQLERLALAHPQTDVLKAACRAVGLASMVAIGPGSEPQLRAEFNTARGPVTLLS